MEQVWWNLDIWILRKDLCRPPMSSDFVKVTREKQSAITKILDIYRTAPFWIITSSTTALFMTMFYIFSEEIGRIPALMFEVLEASILWLWVNAIRQQFKLRRRLEKILEKKWYSENLLKSTLYEWCGVKTTEVATKKYWCADKYHELSEKNKDKRQM